MSSKLFISYSHEDKAVARQVAEALGERGYDVFWDAKIPPGMTFDTYIFEKLQGSNAVIVLWSKHSVHSDYVKEEAEYAKNHRTLVPLNIDGTALPFGFTRIQATDISGWHDAVQDGRWETVVDSIEDTLRRTSDPGAELARTTRESLPVEDEYVSDPPEGQRLQVNVAATLATVIVLIMLVGLVVGLGMHMGSE
jgi:hypothetical protein